MEVQMDVENATVRWFWKSKITTSCHLWYSKKWYILNISGTVWARVSKFGMKVVAEMHNATIHWFWKSRMVVQRGHMWVTSRSSIQLFVMMVSSVIASRQAILMYCYRALVHASDGWASCYSLCLQFGTNIECFGAFSSLSFSQF
jgi:hypothetical protein